MKCLLIAYVLAAIMWTVLVGTAPFLAAMGHRDGPALAGAALVYRTGSVLCHQQAGRSFHVAGVQGPVCARCTGLYVGGAIGALVGVLVVGGRTRRRVVGSRRQAVVGHRSGDVEGEKAADSRVAIRPHVSFRSMRVALVVACLPTAVAWVVEWGGGIPLSNLTRAIGAVPLGAAVSWVVVQSLWQERAGSPDDRAPQSGVN